MIGTVIVWDPFKVFLYHEDYCKNTYVYVNREDMCMKLFERLSDHKKLNSFIIGSSRSQAFKVKDWKNILIQSGKGDIRGFHFDGSKLGLFRSMNVLKFLDKNTDTIKNLLWILDVNGLSEESNPDAPLFSEPPQISGGSYLDYYFEFVNASLYPMFILSSLDFNLNHKFKPYMKKYISRFTYSSDNWDADIYWGDDKEIIRDSIGYYKNRIQSKVFYTRPTHIKEGQKRILGIQLQMLTQIQELCIKNKTNLKIVICPLYDQVPFNSEDKRILMQMFGNENVFDYSGKNNFTESISNFYEASHFRPRVAHQIMKEVYLK